MFRKSWRLAPVLLLAACASQPKTVATKAPEPVTPTEQFKMQAEQAPDQVALAQHADGLSAHQKAALADYARRYLDSGGAALSVKAPAGGGEAAIRMAYAIKAELQAQGVRGGEIVLDPYAAERPDAPVLVVYDHWAAKPIACGRSWDNLLASNKNRPQSNFGCATTANMAAQIADPRDIAGPRSSDPADAGRRTTVIEAYRRGDVTTAKPDPNAKVNISNSVQ